MDALRSRGRWLLLVALLAGACGGGAVAPSPSTGPLTMTQLKYRVMDEAGRPWFCDPDFYPIARADERDQAQQRLPEIQKDAETFSAIVAHLGLIAPPYTLDQQLAIYQDWKSLNALQLQSVTAGVWGFAYLAQRTAGTGERVDGRVQGDGRVTILTRTSAGRPNCPICLARGTRIATPSGDVPVEELREGDVVWTLDGRGIRVAAPLVAVGSTPVPATHEVVQLVLDDDRVVRVSPAHPTADGRRVGDLTAGDTLDGAHVASAARVRYDEGATFDVLPAGATGAYWANGVLLGSTLR